MVDPRRMSLRLASMMFLVGALIGCSAPPAPAAKPTPEAGSGQAEVPKPTATTVAQPAAKAKEPSGQIVFSQGIEVQTLNPALATGIPAFQVLHNVYDALVLMGPDGKLEPMLAESWTMLDDVTWQFKLRRGVKFHNGETFNAEAVRFTLERLLAEQRNPFLNTIQQVDRVEIVDEYTVNILTKKPYPLLPHRLAMAAVIQPPKYTAEKDDAFLATNPVGTGPYKFVEWKRGDRLTIEANPDYWRGAPTVKTIVFKPIPEESTRVAALKTGESTLIVNVAPDKAKELSESQDTKVLEIAVGPHLLFIFRTDLAGPISDPKVRQAINYAVDKESIIKNLLLGYGEVLQGQPSSASIFGFSPDVKAFPYDPDKAKKLLAEAGYPDGLEITFDTPQGRYTKDREVAEAVIGQLAKVGIRGKLDTIEWAVWMERNSKKTFNEIFLVGWTFQVLDMDDSFMTQWPTYWANPEASRRMEEARFNVRPEERTRLYREIASSMVEDPPALFLYLQKTLYAHRSNVKFEPWDEFVRFWYASLT
jgi:peptide/nickel transport system substrate-binding protein